MRSRRSRIGTVPHFIHTNASACTYGATKKDYCSASTVTDPVNSCSRINGCKSKKFDRCPLFLSKTIRKKLMIRDGCY